MKNNKTTPDYWVIRFWNNGEKYRSQSKDFYDYNEMTEQYNKIKYCDNRQIIEVFLHVTSAIGIEAANDEIDTRDLVYEE